MVIFHRHGAISTCHAPFGLLLVVPLDEILHPFEIKRNIKKKSEKMKKREIQKRELFPKKPTNSKNVSVFK